MTVQIGDECYIKVTTDLFRCKVLRQLTSDEVDAEVGPMYEVSIQVYLDEFCEVK